MSTATAGTLSGSDEQLVTSPEWLHRQLRQRDGGCTFPGCHHKRYVVAHHIRFWEWGGPTDLDNLVYVCNFHHKLIHLNGWRVELGKRAGVVYWFRPDYEPYEPNRAPPDEPAEIDYDSVNQLATTSPY